MRIRKQQRSQIAIFLSFSLALVHTRSFSLFHLFLTAISVVFRLCDCWMWVVTYTNYGMKLLEIIKLGIRFLLGWGKPPQHLHTFSPQQLASLMQDAGFTVEESKLIGTRTKALYLMGKKK